MSPTTPAQEAAPANSVAKGIACLVAATLIFSIQDVATKLLVAEYSTFQIVMVRFWAFLVLAVWLVMRNSSLSRAFVTRAVGWQIARGVLLVLDIWLFSEALKTMPLGDISAINMIYPLLVTVFAIPLLGEKVGVFRITAVIVGFAGALVIIRPGFASVEIGVVHTVLASVAYALYLVLTRKVSRVDTTTTSLFYVAAVGLVMTSATGVFFWQPVAPGDWPLIAALCLCACAGHGLVMLSLRYAPASLLQPFNYFSLPWAITLGFLVFGTVIDGFALIGAAMIVSAGLVVMWRERWRARHAAG